MNELLDHRPYRVVLLAAFLALAWAPLLGSLAGVGSDVAQIELRSPAELPKLPTSRAALRALPRAMEKYLNDAFGFRSQLVTANSLLHLALGVSGSDRYVVGRDGWFFHRKVDNVLEQYRGTESFEGQELDHWLATMESRRAWLARRDIDFLVVVAPSKHAIYPEFLPEWVNVVGPTRYEQLRARAADVPWMVDLHEPLRAAKREGKLLYFKTDGHWNDLGAFVAYQEIARWIHARHPEVPVLDRSSFTLAWKTQGVGTITRGLNLHRWVQEPVPSLEPIFPSRVVKIEELGSGPQFNVRYVERARTTLRDRPKVLFMRDSFATPVAAILRETVSETLMTHYRRGRFDRASIRKHDPDIVIYELVERGLRWDPDRDSRGRSRAR